MGFYFKRVLKCQRSQNEPFGNSNVVDEDLSYLITKHC